MKFPLEFRHQILGIISFLVLFCTFSSCSDFLSFNYDSDSDEELFPSGTANINGTGKTAPDPHVISLLGEGRFDRKIECRGSHVTNLTFIECESSFLECRKKMACLINGTMCTSHDQIVSGTDCFAGHFYHIRRGYITEKCLTLETSWGMRAGIIQCTSSLSSPVSFALYPPAQKSNTTIDYFYIGVYLKIHLLSKLEQHLKPLMKLGWDYAGESIIMEQDEKIYPITFYTNEQILLYCTTSSFLFDLHSIKIEARTKNGTEFKIDPALFFESSGGSYGLPIYLKNIDNFRMPKDISTLTCSSRRLDNSETIQRTWNVTVIDPPLRLFAKSPNGSEFQVVSKIGCNLSPSIATEELKIIRKRLSHLLDISRQSEFWITSVIQFLRFQNITGGNYSCNNLQSQGNSNSNGSSVDRFDYYFDLEVKRATIEKPDGSSSIILKGHSHLSLKCKYTGKPMPYVIWLHSGKEIFYTLQTKRLLGEGDFEESVLHLPIENLGNGTGMSSEIHSKNSSGLNSSLIEEYSCVAQNHLGTDRLDFVIENEDNSPGFKFSGTSSGSGSALQSQSKSEPGEKSGLIYGVIISCLLLFIFIGLFYLIFTRGKYQTKRTIVAKCRGDENGGETLDADSIHSPSHSHSHTDSTNKEFYPGVSIASKFQSGDAKYKILNVS